eukprot:TRINITY_DN8323_c0_g1_i2.p2 TRINITY_DN8323_c0_g1~~TRINITY_DN8323_c0_g1_i2.p2  ORF type:complete len:123 (-),score=35.20 TRINITY_DN8323_c0_g1_i2:3-371(-)
MIRRPPRSTHCISSAASDVYKRQVYGKDNQKYISNGYKNPNKPKQKLSSNQDLSQSGSQKSDNENIQEKYKLQDDDNAVSYTHLRAHETRHDLVCRLLLEKKKQEQTKHIHSQKNITRHTSR